MFMKGVYIIGTIKVLLVIDSDFLTFSKSGLNLEHFQKKDDPHS